MAPDASFGNGYSPSTTPHPDSTFDQMAIVPELNLTIRDSYYLGDNVNTAIITVTLMLCCVTVVLNLGVMSHYWSKVNNIYDNMVPFIYFILSLSDFATGICAGLHTILFSLMLGLKGRDLTPANVLWIIVPSYFLSVVAFKVSAYVSMTFAVIRTINIASPFYKVNRRAAITSIIIWLSFWVLVSFVEMGLQGNLYLRSRPVDDLVKNVLINYFYQPNKLKLIIILCFPEYDDGSGSGVKAECVADLVYTALPVFLCAGVGLIATVIQVVILLGGKTVRGKAGSEDDMRRRVGITVIMIGVVFIVCSSCTLYQPLHLCDKGSTGELSVLYFMGYFPFFINSALNPLILVVRAHKLRECLWNRVRGRSCGHCNRVSPLSPARKENERKCENVTSGTEMQSWSLSSSGFRGILRSISGYSSKSAV